MILARSLNPRDTNLRSDALRSRSGLQRS
ncbi:BnaC03g23010D [Brassica napus]|uniref:BnaC03g23010D protein n=1 Tax=Brassica napus TaxID=3708 RepID=A0A078GAT8_BRANA|nr:BnaC03g23010D [Brassica napus]